jgi:chromate reductase
MHLTVVSGTNRPHSNTRKVAGYVHRFLKSSVSSQDEIELLDLQDLPAEIFSPTSYATKPKSFEKFSNELLNTDGMIIVLPEYNGGPPGVFKYFVDMLPFPTSLEKKPSAFVGVADGRFGALRPVEQMQAIWSYRKAYLYPEKVLIPFIEKSIDAEGCPTDPTTLKLLQSELTGFINFAKKFKT